MRSFKSYNKTEIEKFIQSLNLNRAVKEIHIHHTWRPTKSQYDSLNTLTNKERVIWGMWNYHVNTRGWGDIGQHFSVGGDGLIWDGRSLESNPASITGRNTGAIAIEMIGDFDVEKLEGEQLASVVVLVKTLIKKFNLTEKNIIFHNEYSSKTCPGNSIKKDWFLSLLKGVRTKDIHIVLHDTKISVKGIFEDGTNYVPVRFLEELGYQIGWDGKNVLINYRK